MRTLSQFVGVLLIVGFVGAYFWWIVAVVAVVGLTWLAARAYPIARAEFEANTQRRACRAAEVVRRADQQHAWVLAGDDRGWPFTAPSWRYSSSSRSSGLWCSDPRRFRSVQSRSRKHWPLRQFHGGTPPENAEAEGSTRSNAYNCACSARPLLHHPDSLETVCRHHV
jgi:hypothetical protein